MEKIKIQDLLTYRFLGDLTAAPRGEKAVFTVRQAREKENDYRSDLYLYTPEEIRRLTFDGKSQKAIWEDENHLLFAAMREKEDRERAKNGEHFSVWYRLDLRGGEAERAFELPVACNSLKHLQGTQWFFTAAFDRAHPDEYAMSAEERKKLLEARKEDEDYHILTDISYRFNGEGFCEGEGTALFLWDSQSGKTQRLTSEDVDVDYADVYDGKIVYTAKKYSKTANFYNQLYLYDPVSAETQTLYGGNDYSMYEVCKAGGQWLVLASDMKAYGLNQNAAVYRLNDGVLTQLCAPDVGFGNSVGSDCRLGGGHNLKVFKEEMYYICTCGGDAQLRKIDAEGNETVVNNRTGSLDCFDITEQGTVLGVGMYDFRLQELYAIGTGTQVKCLSSLNEAALSEHFVSCPQPLTVQSHGETVQGWVLLPMDYDASKTYPAVLDIHGGPKTVYGEVFYHEMQVWASNGYFVFFCNPTGSDGRGDAFADIRGKYGTVDYENLMDFTDAVLNAYPQIDKDKVAVTGGSYGGFMTNWIIGHTSRFACAATQRSISNWFSFYGVSDIGPYFAKDQTGGDVLGPDENQEKMWFHSPLRYVDNVTTPTLFIHSDEDYRCPIDQGLQLYIALLQKGVDTRFIWFKGENHELSRSGKPKHRMKRLLEITNWIEKYTR